MTKGGNAVPMGFNHLGKLSVWFQTRPFQTVFLALEEGTSTAFGTVVPELSEGFLEVVGRVQTPISLEQFFKGTSSIQTQVLAPGEQCITLALGITPVLATETFVLIAPDLIRGL